MATNTATKVSDIITLALKDAGIVGVGQAPSATDSNDALTRLNWMISQWATKRFLVWHEVSLSVVSTGAQSYTLGVGGNFNYPSSSNAARPSKIESAFFRQTNIQAPNQPDYPVEVLQSRDDYNMIALKALVAFPSYVFLDADFPLANVFFWPLPQPSIYTLFVSVKAQLLNVDNLAQTLVIPPEYFAALHSNLGVLLRDAYGLPPKAINVGKAKAALSALRNANTQVPRLQVPAELLRAGSYNPYSDQIR